MTLFAIGLSVFAQICLVCGQLLLKHAMIQTNASTRVRLDFIRPLALGISLMTLWFLLWLYLLQDWDLSQLFPFEGLTPPLLVLGAWFFLNERVSLRGWIGIGLIGLGAMVVSQS